MEARALLSAVVVICVVLPAITLAANVNDKFDPGADSSVSSIAVRADGKILVGGSFTLISGQARNRIARLNTDGSVDASFNPDADNIVNSIAVQADGKILVGGFFTAVGGQARNRIARLNADGSLETSFNPDASSVVSSIAVQEDGKILVGGGFTSIGGQARNRIARLNADGSLDTSFNPNASGFVNSIAVQADGRILVGGGFTSIGGQARNRIARLNTDGSVDGTFNPGADNAVWSIAVQADGTIVVGGSFTTMGGQPRNHIARLNSNGTVDTAFNPNADNDVRSIAVQANGTIVVGGLFTAVGGQARSRIARLDEDGSVETIFNPGANASVIALAVQEDGKILAGGLFTTMGGQTRNRIARLYADGSVDATLDPGPNASVIALAVQPDGMILAGGDFSAIGGQAKLRMARLKADGSVDVTFTTAFAGAEGIVHSLAVQADGKIVVGGDFTTIGGQPRNRIARLNADGSLEATFNPNANSNVISIAVQADGKIVVGGDFTTVGGQPRNHIARLNANGSLDTTFNPNANFTVYSLAVQADGKILAGGSFMTIGGQARNRLARLNTDGSVDGTFNPGADNAVWSIAVQADGKILAGGSFMTIGGQARNRLARLNPNGTVDTAFNPDANGDVRSIVLQADGKIVVGGVFTTISGQPRNRLARLNPNGSLDTSFDPDADSLVTSLAVQADGKILAGGIFTTMSGQLRKRIARLSADDAALQELTVSDDGTTITWMRSGSSPELFDVTFEQAPDAATWTALGRASRIPGGWRLTGLTLPFNTTYYVRARGRASGGMHNASTGLVESVSQFWSPPFLRINDVSKAEGNTGATAFTFTVTLSPSGAGTVMVDYATANGTALAGNDYTAASGTLTFLPGETTKTVTVNVSGDTVVEPNETFFVNLSDATGATIFDGHGQGTIVNDDGPRLSINDVSRVEGNAGTTALTFTVTLSPASAGTVTLNYTTVNGTALAGSDYTATSGTLTFSPTQTSKTVTVNVTGDTAVESNEVFYVNLVSATGASIFDAWGIGTIINDDGPKLSINDVSSAEGNVGSKAYTFTVTLSPASAGTVTLNYTTVNGTALAGSDYTATSGTLTFSPNQTTKTVTVNVTGDMTVELNEVFYVNLVSATGASIFDAWGIGTIVNDDGPVLRINDVSSAEGNAGSKAFTFTVTLSPASAGTVTLNYTTVNGTALAGSDYTTTSGTLTFSPTQTSKTVTVNVTGDTAVESNEVFYVNLVSATGASIFDAWGIGTIVNDDGPVLRINDVSSAEGNAGSKAFTFTVTLSPASAGTVTVQYTTVNGTALAGSDYTAASGTLTFSPTQTSKTVTVNVTGDAAVESNEVFYVNLVSATGASIFDAWGIGAIINDDGPKLSINDVSRAEGNAGTTAFTFTVTLSPASAGTVTVQYATVNGTAQAGSDYTAASGTLTFSPNQTSKTVTVNVTGDTTVEPNEVFYVNLVSATGASIFDAWGIGTIVNDD